MHLIRAKWKLSLLAALMALLGVLVLTACGSSSDTSSSTGGSETETETSEPAEEESSGSTITIAGKEVDTTKEYVEGVPNLEELYKGGEEAPPTEGPPIKKGVSVVFVSCGQESPGCAGVPNAMVEPAEKLGWDYRIIDGKLNLNNGWLRGVREAIAIHPDVIIVHGMGCEEVKQPLVEAKAANIPVMGLEDLDCDEGGLEEESLLPLEMQYNKEMLTGEDYFRVWGEMEGAYGVNASLGEGKILQTSYTGSNGHLVAVGREEVQEKCSGCEVVDDIEFGPSDQTPNGPLFQKTSTALVQHPEANVFQATWDTTINTAGLAKAIVDAGRAQDMVVVGGEGYAPALQLIEEEKGVTAECAAHSGAWMAWGALDEINRFVNGEPSVPQGLGFVCVDKEHNMPPAGQDYETKVPFQADYEKLWGLK